LLIISFDWVVAIVVISCSPVASGWSRIYTPCSLTNENLWEPTLDQPEYLNCFFVPLPMVAEVNLGIIGMLLESHFPFFMSNRKNPSNIHKEIVALPVTLCHLDQFLLQLKSG
jgi:hypothetical protein